MTPRPLQRKRTKGYRYPEGVKVLTVTRGTVYGNPYAIKEHKHANGSVFYVLRPDGKVSMRDFISHKDAARFAAEEYREYILGICDRSPAIYAAMMQDVMRHDYIACWCPLDAPCHRDALIKLATEWQASLSTVQAKQGAKP